MGAMKHAYIGACEDIERIRAELATWYRYNCRLFSFEHRVRIRTALRMIREVSVDCHASFGIEHMPMTTKETSNRPFFADRADALKA